MLTVIIPAREEVYLQKTIDNVLENAEGEIEIIAILDGWKPEEPVKDHPFVRTIYNPEPKGQRPSINDAARIARGNMIMKLDAHCAVSPGFNTILERDCKYEWTMVPRMYNLDHETWLPKKHKRTDYMFIGLVNGHLRAQYYPGSGMPQPKNNKEIDETMCCMGPGFVMHKERFWELGGCDEDHAHWGQQGVEVSCKAWLSGGKLMVHKGCWFAHWFRGSYIHPSGRKGFPYKLSMKDVNKSRQHSDDIWLNNKWEKQTRTFQWLLEKFKPPTWHSYEYPADMFRMPLYVPLYKHIHRSNNHPEWKGIKVLKFPSDMALYWEAIADKKPEIIVEVGTKYGGSALFYQDMMDQFYKGGKVITIDVADQVKEKDPRITYLHGSSLDKPILDAVRNATKGKQTMVVLDGNHQRVHVKNELQKYKDIVSPGQYLVVEDCFIDRGLYGPGQARDWFLETRNGWELEDRCGKYLAGVTMGGGLKRAA